VFVICRLLGRIVLEQRMGRVRRGAVVSHAITGLFLAAAGVAYLRQTEWVIKAYDWVRNVVA
jgi:eukaryotic-like serine/threonine-protein kinase